MPDRYGDEPIDLNGPDDVWAAGQRRKYAIVNCGMCDDDGYAGLRVCDHIDHTEAARRGMEKVRAALGLKAEADQ
ncbi:hypothetical protein [Mycolicibacterium gilvum]|uniref:hypothetical protein n=1 Tax=Mycolicibacterium gilvum TaxID=1804 RepID=UPI00404601BB